MESLQALAGGQKPSVNFGKVNLTEEEQHKVIIFIGELLKQRSSREE